MTPAPVNRPYAQFQPPAADASVDLLLARLTALRDHFRQTKDGRIHLPFLQTYRRSTRCLLDLISHREPGAISLEPLAADFAGRYVRALNSAVVRGKARPPWRPYFAYTQQGGGRPFLALLLGVKTHVCGDLPASLRATGMNDHSAFCTFDAALRALSPFAVQYALASAQPAVRAALGFHPAVIRSGYDLSVARWRAQAWMDREASEASEITERACWRLIAVLDPIWWARRKLEGIQSGDTATLQYSRS